MLVVTTTNNNGWPRVVGVMDFLTVAVDVNIDRGKSPNGRT